LTICAGVNNTSSKFAAGVNWCQQQLREFAVGVNNNGGNFLPASKTMVLIWCRRQQQQREFSAGVDNNGRNLLPASTPTA
jgi:hypothetical protein